MFTSGYVRFSIALVMGVLMVALYITPALASGAELVLGDSVELLWTKLDLIQKGQAMPTNVHSMTQEEFHMTVLGEDLPESPAFSNEFVFSLHPYWVGFDIPYGSYTDEIVYLYDRVPPMIVIGDEMSVGDIVHARVQIDHSPSILHMHSEGSFALWQFASLNNLEFPRIGYGTVSIPHASLSAGRFKTGIGNGYFGNTFLNGLAPHYDQVQFSLYSEKVKFFYMLGTSSPFLTSTEAAIQLGDTNWDPLNNPDHAKFNEPVKTFAYHRFEYHPAAWVTVGLHEMNIIGGKTPDFNHINPFGFWHNTYTAGFSNVMFGLDASVVPVKGLLLYGEFTVDDIRASWAEAANSKPSTFAWQVGAKYVLPWSGEIKHAVGAEFTHVDPWTYNRWQPYLTMYQRMIRVGGGHFVDVPLGYLYGGDLNHYGLYYTMIRKDGLRVDFSYDHLDKGPIDLGMQDADGDPIYYDHPDYQDVTTGPFGHGIVEQKDTLTLAAVYPLPWNLEAVGSLHYSWFNNFNHVDGATETLGVVYLGVRWHF